MSEEQASVPMTSNQPPRALGAFGFASFMRSGFEPGDEEMVAKKLEVLGHRIEMLEGRVEWLGEIANVCVYEEIRRVCSYCHCKRKSDK